MDLLLKKKAQTETEEKQHQQKQTNKQTRKYKGKTKNKLYPIHRVDLKDKRITFRLNKTTHTHTRACRKKEKKKENGNRYNRCVYNRGNAGSTELDVGDNNRQKRERERKRI